MRYCLCCDRTLLQHICHGQTYWYCPHCHQAMPSAVSEYSAATFSHKRPDSSGESAPEIAINSSKTAKYPAQLVNCVD